MDSQTVLAMLSEHMPLIRERFAVESLGVFGSFARAEAKTDSDIDLLVRFSGPACSNNYFGLLFYLEDLLKTKVDLVTDKALRHEFRARVERELIHV